MDSILDAAFDIDKPNFRRFDETEYAVKLRRYAGGNIKATIIQYSAMQKERCSFMYQNPGFVSQKPKPQISDAEKEEKRLASHERNVSRARQVVTDLIMQLQADRLITLTYRENMMDRERLKRDFKEFLRLVRKRYKEFSYVAVPEVQERGALHVHIASKGFIDVTFLRGCWYRALGGDVSDSRDTTRGQVDITSPAQRRWGTEKGAWSSKLLARYLTKYLHKTFDETQAEKRRYWSARSVRRPEAERVWLCSSDMWNAIPELIDMLRLSDGLTDDFCLWISQGGGLFSLSGSCDG